MNDEGKEKKEEKREKKFKDFDITVLQGEPAWYQADDQSLRA